MDGTGGTEPRVVNAAVIGDIVDADFLTAALQAAGAGASVLIGDDAGLTLPGVERMTLAEAALDTAPIDPEEVLARLRARLSARPGLDALIMDMGWALVGAQGRAGTEGWGGVADRLAQEMGLAVVSLYPEDLAIEEHLQAAMRAHRQFAAPGGLYDNPYWIPSDLRESASLDEQLRFMLGRIVPDYRDRAAQRPAEQMFARGATPSWLGSEGPGLGAPPSQSRWHIHCLGELRVYVGNRLVDWRVPGGSPHKTRTLFAYLLQSGDKGAHADQIGELLWPGDGSEEQKRSRLHHTVAMLRKVLGQPQAVLRNGETYRLNPPPGTWIDIDSFEQLCRRGLSLFKRGQLEAALRIYAAADQLYGGDLFEDLPLEYVESDAEDWCMARRIWLREMALKLQYDFAKVCQKSGRSREALEHCQKALAIDPTSEGAHAEAMRIFVAQGRVEAMHRQYRQYRAALAAIGAQEGAEIRHLYRELSRNA